MGSGAKLAGFTLTQAATVGSFRHGRVLELRRRTVLKPAVRGVWRRPGLFTLDARFDNGLNDVNILRLPHFAIKQAAGVPVHWD